MTAGCNAAHRTPPLAMCHPLRSDDDIVAAAVAECRITHHSPIAAHTSGPFNLAFSKEKDCVGGIQYTRTYTHTRAQE
eukprot:48690-Eustigmatos_ZCMA.PRE.1